MTDQAPTNVLAELARHTDAQRKKYSPERKERGRYLSNLCVEEGYDMNIIRLARIGGTEAVEGYLLEDD